MKNCETVNKILTSGLSMPAIRQVTDHGNWHFHKMNNCQMHFFCVFVCSLLQYFLLQPSKQTIQRLKWSTRKRNCENSFQDKIFVSPLLSTPFCSIYVHSTCKLLSMLRPKTAKVEAFRKCQILVLLGQSFNSAGQFALLSHSKDNHFGSIWLFA